MNQNDSTRANTNSEQTGNKENQRKNDNLRKLHVFRVSFKNN